MLTPLKIPGRLAAAAIFLAGAASLCAEEGPRAASTVILTPVAEENLRISTETAEERPFESTSFVIGRLEEPPQNRAVLSSRISGRVVSVRAFVGDEVAEGDVLAQVESRQAGNPPPVIDLLAPRGGLVVDSHINLGQPVDPDQELMDISDRAQLWGVARIPENAAKDIKVGAAARIVIPALGGEPIEAELVRYGVAADRGSSAVEGIFHIDNPDGLMVPGMRAEFSIITKSRPNVMSIPKVAVQGDPTKRVVFVEDFELDHAYVRAPVVLGEENDRYVEVISGLFPGDEVVVTGSYSLSFAGSGGGQSLKEALDAAHGHEHNEDGSPMTAEDIAARDAAKAAAGGGSVGSGSEVTGRIDLAVRIWAVVATLLLLVFIQRSLRRKADTPVA